MINNIQELVPRPLRNKYVFTSVVFIVWILFFDRYSIIAQLRLRGNLASLERKIKFLKKDMQADLQTLNTVFTDDNKLVKVARERYFMKAENEEVIYIKDPEITED